MLAIVIGALVGYAIGASVVLTVHRVRYSGSPSDIVVWLVGLPILLAIGGAVVGSLVAAWPTVQDVDAPIRVRRFARQRRAATSEQGQLPGSPVEPRYAPSEHPDPAISRKATTERLGTRRPRLLRWSGASRSALTCPASS